jgi:sporulation protein YlmC with PRC-barrel domain
MKKLHTIAFYALITPAIALGSGSLLAGQSDDQERYDKKQTAEKTAENDKKMMHNGDYINKTPANGMHASNLIGATINTNANEEVGEVRDLIIGEDGQVLGVIVGVGGFLGMGERDVAINWNDITKTGSPENRELKVNMTRQELRDIPEFKREPETKY